MTTTDWKNGLRKQVEGMRSELTKERHAAMSEAICRNLRQATFCTAGNSITGRDAVCKNSSAKRITIFTYLPFRSEVDVTPFIADCWSDGHRIAVPRVNKQERTFQLHIIQSFDELTLSGWSIREPRPDTPALADIDQIDLILVPGIAFDRQGGRLGYGGGYYDRFMREYDLRGIPHPRKIAPAFSFQLVDEVPMEEHDFYVDKVVTESEIV